jgi:hypothetical protein
MSQSLSTAGGHLKAGTRNSEGDSGEEPGDVVLPGDEVTAAVIVDIGEGVPQIAHTEEVGELELALKLTPGTIEARVKRRHQPTSPFHKSSHRRALLRRETGHFRQDEEIVFAPRCSMKCP